MRHTGNTHTKHGTGRLCGLLLPLAVFLALLVPVGAVAGVKQDAADPTVRLPAAVFGVGHATAAANVSLDEYGKDKDDDKGDKKCKEHKEDCDPPAEEPQPHADEDPTASWAGVPIFLPNL